MPLRIGTTYLTVKEVCARLDITQPRVATLIQSGRLKATKHAGAWFIAEQDLAAVAVRPTGWPRGRKRGPRKKKEKKDENSP